MEKAERAISIEAAAYDVLQKKGFKGTSMLEVARAAKASNETLYRWYGDKIGLFTAMIERNTEQVEAELSSIRTKGGAGPDALLSVAQALLSMVTSEKAIALNRAAAADATGVLGQALLKNGRARVMPLLLGLLEDLYGNDAVSPERVEVLISLLIGDLQIRRAIGVLPPLTEAEIVKRANRAVRQFQTLYPLAAKTP